MNEQDYIKLRLDDQLAWYDRKSCWNQRWYKRLILIEIISASLIPFLASATFQHSNLIIGFLGIIIAVSTATASLFKFSENWVQYRTTAESLKHEKFCYLTHTHPYDSDSDRFQILVNKVESLISKENSNWTNTVQKNTTTKNNLKKTT